MYLDELIPILAIVAIVLGGLIGLGVENNQEKEVKIACIEAGKSWVDGDCK